MLIASNHSHERLECSRCRTVLMQCRCAGKDKTVRTVVNCNICLPLSDYDAAQLKRRNERGQ